VCRLLPYREELEWPEKAWRRFEREIYPFVEGRPNPEDLLKEQEEEMKANPTKPLQRMVVMMGVPGSGNPLLVVDAVVSVARCLTSLSLSLLLCLGEHIRQEHAGQALDRRLPRVRSGQPGRNEDQEEM
jgi:hypothetical protein